MGKRQIRHEVIREVIRGRGVKTQQDLVDALSARGFRCTQATVSRDVQEIGLVKGANGCYVLAEELRLQRMISELVVDAAAAGHFVVVHTMGGSASSLAAAIDESRLMGVLGTVAGDDTVFIAVDTEEHVARVLALFMGLIGQN